MLSQEPTHIHPILGGILGGFIVGVVVPALFEIAVSRYGTFIIYHLHVITIK